MRTDEEFAATQRRAQKHERCDQRNDVANIVEDAVGVDLRRCAGFAKTAHVRRDDAKAGRRERGNLMPPGIGQFRPAVAQHDQWTFALFEQKHLDPVDRNRA